MPWPNVLERESSMLGASICIGLSKRASVKSDSVVHESWVFRCQSSANHSCTTRDSSSSSLTCVTLYNVAHDALFSCSEANHQYWTQWSHYA